MSEPAAGITAEYLELNDRLRKIVRPLDTERLDREPADGENTIAVLVAHTIGSELGWLSLCAGRQHQRDRDAEFRTRGRSAADLVGLIDSTDARIPDLVEAAVAAGLDTMRATGPGREWSVARSIAHSLAHTAEHVAHAELTRNLVAPERRG